MISGAIVSAVLGSVWAWVVGVVTAFGIWIAGAAAFVLAFLFSPAIRKYTIAALALVALVGSAYIYGGVTWSQNAHCQGWEQIRGTTADKFSAPTLKKFKAHNANGVKYGCWEPLKK